MISVGLVFVCLPVALVVVLGGVWRVVRATPASTGFLIVR